MYFVDGMTIDEIGKVEGVIASGYFSQHYSSNQKNPKNISEVFQIHLAKVAPKSAIGERDILHESPFTERWKTE